MNDVLCRLCLRKDNLSPIFVDLEQPAEYSKVLKLTTGLKINLNDGLPQYICTVCTNLVNKSVALRNQSQLSEKKLIQAGYIKKVYNTTEDFNSEILDLKSECHFEPNLKPLKKGHNLNKSSDVSDLKLECTGLNSSLEKSAEVSDLKLECTELDSSLEESFKLKLECDTNLKLIKQPVFKKSKANLKKRTGSENVSQLPVSEKNNGTEGKKEKASGANKQPQMSKKQKRAMYMELVEGVFDPKGPVKCKICKKTVSKWACFVSHAKLHLGFKFMCEYCGKDFISSTQLKRHCRSFHGMARELSCKYCSYLALDAPQLLLHERRAHTGERPFVCDLCGARYHSRRCLLQHLESHRSTRDVQCPDCPTRVKSRRHLARHRYSAHCRKRAS